MPVNAPKGDIKAASQRACKLKDGKGAGEVLEDRGSLLQSCANALPLCYVCQLFEALVEGVMRFGIWLYATAPGAAEVLDDLYTSWARSLMGAAPWRNWATCVNEFGWQLTGQGRGIVDVAMRRFYLWTLPDGDIYKRVFLRSAECIGDTWAKRSLALLEAWGVVDWPCWASPSRSKGTYKLYVKGVLQASCRGTIGAFAAHHTLPVSYVAIRNGPCTDLADGLAKGLPWYSLLLQRSLGRLRAGILEFAHLNGSRSNASRRRCIFCEELTLSVNFHVLCVCGVWAEMRAAIWSAHQMPRAPLCPAGHLNPVLNTR